MREVRPLWRPVHRLLLRIVAAWLLATGVIVAGQVRAPTAFATRVAELSEPGGYFEADNLISNETSYLQVMSALRGVPRAGGAYIGVGPDQNFSYIAQLKPSIAFIVDIRRDNMLLQLLCKALFQLSSTRVEYLSLLSGRPAPRSLAGWRNADINRLIAYVDSVRPSPGAVAALRQRVDRTIRAFGLPLSTVDWSTIDRFHRTFIDSGLSLKFETFTRGVRPYFPTYRDLLLERDDTGQQSNYLASEERFQFVRSLEQRDLVIPVVGNFVGPHALVAIGRLMGERGVGLSAFYASNVEYYLFADGTFQKFVDNLSHIPHTDRSLIVRSVFAGGIASLMPQAVPGYPSASIVQSFNELLEGYRDGRFHEYGELTTVSVPRYGGPER
jgi:hypothetical protein